MFAGGGAKIIVTPLRLSYGNVNLAYKVVAIDT